MEVDQTLIADALAKAGPQIHLVSSFVSGLKCAVHLIQEDPSDAKVFKNAVFFERVLRSFLVTGDIRKSEQVIEAAISAAERIAA